MGRHFLIRSDHIALTYLRSAKELIGQQARWLDSIEEFDFELQHRASVAHGNADALSRRYSADNVGQQPCIQSHWRRFYDEDQLDACQARGGAMVLHQVWGDSFNLEKGVDSSISCVCDAADLDQLGLYVAEYEDGFDPPPSMGTENTAGVLCRMHRHKHATSTVVPMTVPKYCHP